MVCVANHITKAVSSADVYRAYPLSVADKTIGAGSPLLARGVVQKFKEVSMLVLPRDMDVTRGEPGFLSKYAALLDIGLRVGDLAIAIVTAVLAARWRFGTWSLPRGYTNVLVPVVLLTAIVFPAYRLYASWRGSRIRHEALRLVLAWSTVAAAMLVIDWAIKRTAETSRLWAGSWFLLALVLFIISRVCVRVLLGWVRSRGIDQRKVVLVGATDAGAKIVAAARTRSHMGLAVSGYVSTPFDQRSYDGVPCLGDLDGYLQGIEDCPPDQLWVALPFRAEACIQRIMDATSALAIQVRLVPDFFGYQLINHHAGSVAGVPIITLRGSRVEGHARILKAVEDRVLGSLLLLIAVPVMILLAVGVKFSSPGPVFYRQRRIGLDGQEFEILKFRSMPVDSEKHGVKWGAAKNKPTGRFGRFIRRTSLDELPQLINVVRGDLSLVGPRPERPMFVEEFRKRIPGYMHKHMVKAGITGLAQINGWRGDSDLSKRIECDLDYIQNWSLWLDLKILLLTPFALFRNAY